MPFWMIVLVLITLLCLCWDGGWGIYRGVPAYGYMGGLLGPLGAIILIVLVFLFLNGTGGAELGAI